MCPPKSGGANWNSGGAAAKIFRALRARHFLPPYFFIACSTPGSSLPRNNFYDQNWQGSGLGEYPKKFGATVEASYFKFGVQLGRGE